MKRSTVTTKTKSSRSSKHNKLCVTDRLALAVAHQAECNMPTYDYSVLEISDMQDVDDQFE